MLKGNRNLRREGREVRGGPRPTVHTVASGLTVSALFDSIVACLGVAPLPLFHVYLDQVLSLHA